MSNETHFMVVVDPLDSIVRLTRGALPLSSPQEITRAFEKLQPIVQKLPPDGRLLFDVRNGEKLIRPELERFFRVAFAELVRRFSRVAVLHHSAIGKLQYQRFVREENLAAQVFVNLKLAEAFLTEASP